VIARKFGSKSISAITGGLDLLPWSGPLFLLSVLALSAMPPFGIFRSEFEIVAGGFASSGDAAAAALIIAVTVAFLGLSIATNRMLFTPRAAVTPERAGLAATLVAAGDRPAPIGRPGVPVTRAPEPALTRGEPSAWMVIPVVVGVAALVMLGVHPPAELTGLLSRAVHQLSGGA